MRKLHLAFAVFGTLVFVCPHVSISAQTRKHDTWRSQMPFEAKDVQTAAREVEFEKQSSVPAEASDVIDYFDPASTPSLKKDGLTLLGIMRVKMKGVTVRGVKGVLPPGDYYHWIGKKSGSWLGGLSAVKGNFSMSTEVLFGEMPIERKHKASTHVFVHDPEDLKTLRTFASAMAASATAAAAQRPGQRPPPPPPPPPPRCILQCRWIVDLDDGLHKWVPTIWLIVP